MLQFDVTVAIAFYNKLKPIIMMFSNSIRKTIGRVWNQLFDPWWNWYYTYFRHPPKRHCKEDSWIIEHWDENPYDPVCFPLPFWINCIGCWGCSHVKDPPLTPDKRKGPYKVFFHPNFINQLEGLIGKQETFKMVWDLQKKHNEIDARATVKL